MLVHLIQGHSAAFTLRKTTTGRSAEVLTIPDELPWPSIPEDAPPSAWLEPWTAYWRTRSVIGLYEGWLEESREIATTFIEGVTNLGADDRVALWLGPSLCELLATATGVELLARVGVGADRVSIITTDRNERGERFRSNGEIPLEQLDRAVVRMRAVDPGEAEWLRRAWRAFSSDSPAALNHLWSTPAGSAELWRRRSELIATYYPESRSGVSEWQRMLLRLASTAPSSHIMPMIQRSFALPDSDPLFGDAPGDLWLVDQLVRLSQEELDRPFVKVEGVDATTAEEWQSSATVQITNLGRRVLAGDVNALDLGELTYHIGGVHLDSKTGGMWCREGARLRRVERQSSAG